MDSVQLLTFPRVKEPHWPLDEVKRLAAAGTIWVQKTRAAAFFPTTREAVEVATEIALTLDVGAFSCTQELTHDVADVYGIVRDGDGWFLKLCIDVEAPELLIISLHPLERPLVTNAGVVKP